MNNELVNEIMAYLKELEAKASADLGIADSYGEKVDQVFLEGLIEAYARARGLLDRGKKSGRLVK